MKDEWYGDRRDLVKWGVLSELAERFKAARILQVPYYRPSKWKDLEIDGQPRPIPASVLKHFRAIANIQRLRGVWRVQVVRTAFVDRVAYARIVRRAITRKSSGRSIIFLDPDTGLAPRKPGPEHVLDSELAAIWKEMRYDDVLVFYQHQTNRNGQPWIEPKRQQFESVLGLPKTGAKVAWAPGVARDVVFFFSQKGTGYAGDGVKVEALSPAECPSSQVKAFSGLVREGGEVEPAGLEDRIRAAMRLVFLYDGDELAGIAAIKRPHHGYRRSVFKNAGVALHSGAYPLELGWVVVAKAHRRKGYSARLVAAAMKDLRAADVFATSRTDNEAMHKSLERYGFRRRGSSYLSGRRNHTLALFVGGSATLERDRRLGGR